MENFFFYGFFMRVFSLILIRKHILLCLIRLEFVVLSLLIVIYFYCLIFNYSLYIYLIIITFFVCEGVIGLSIIVYLIRCHGNDYLNSIFIW